MRSGTYLTVILPPGGATSSKKPTTNPWARENRCLKSSCIVRTYLQKKANSQCRFG